MTPVAPKKDQTMATRRYVHLKHWDDHYEVLIVGNTILRIHKLFSDSGMIRSIPIEELPEGLKDQLEVAVESVDYEI